LPQDPLHPAPPPEDLIPDASPFVESSVDLEAVWQKLRAGRRTIFGFSLAVTIVAAVVALLIPNVYTATATFLVPHNASNGASAFSAQLTLLSSGNLPTSFRSPGDLEVGILQSRTVTAALISRFHLMQVYKVKKLSAAETTLLANTIFDSGTRDDIIRVSVTNKDPALACDLANGYLDELHNAHDRLALTEASQRRLFFEQQLGQEKTALEDAEADLQKTQEQTGLIAPNSQTAVSISALAQTRAQIDAREVELTGMLQGSTEQDPAVVRLRSEIAGLKQQLDGMMHGGSDELGGIPEGKVPALQLEYLRKQREVGYHDALYEILTKQYEAARLDESHDAPILQVVDPAIVPDTKSGPHRSIITLVSLLIALVLSSAWVLVQEHARTYLQRIRS